MAQKPLTVHDLPLGTVAPDAPYNALLLRGIESLQNGRQPDDAQLDEIENAREELWEDLNRRKAEGLGSYGRFAAEAYGFRLSQDGTLNFDWKKENHRRVGWGSHFYRCDVASKTLVAHRLDPSRPRVIVFATGRAFAEKNARLTQLTLRESLMNARNVMSAQIYLTGSRLTVDYPESPTQVVAVAYDMVTSETETPAMRIQALLDPEFIHPVSIMAAERIFGPLIARARFNPDGTFTRNEAGEIDGTALSGDEILRNVSRIVLVGGSVGCIVVHQAIRWLDHLLRELDVDEKVRSAVRQSILIIHLGPTTVLNNDLGTNRISVINKTDEFVFSGNDHRKIVTASEQSGNPFVADGSHGYHIVLNAASTIYRDSEGKRIFDPIGSHFGHSLKHYTNRLRDLGLATVIQRCLDIGRPFLLRELLEHSRQEGDLDIPEVSQL